MGDIFHMTSGNVFVIMSGSELLSSISPDDLKALDDDVRWAHLGELGRGEDGEGGDGLQDPGLWSPLPRAHRGPHWPRGHTRPPAGQELPLLRQWRQRGRRQVRRVQMNFRGFATRLLISAIVCSEWLLTAAHPAQAWLISGNWRHIFSQSCSESMTTKHCIVCIVHIRLNSWIISDHNDDATLIRRIDILKLSEICKINCICLLPYIYEERFKLSFSACKYHLTRALTLVNHINYKKSVHMAKN